jgi:hypothetical protein
MAAAPALALAAPEALAQLDAVDVGHPFDAALTDVAVSLAAIDLVVRAFAPSCPMRIFGRVAAYRTAN